MGGLAERAARARDEAKPGRQKAARQAVVDRVGATEKARAERRHRNRAEVLDDPDRRFALLALLAHGLTVTKACRIVGTTTRKARGLYHRDDEFRVAWDTAMDTGTDMIDDKIMDIGLAAKDERIRLDALKFLAKARKPDVYSESQKLAVTTQAQGPTRERLTELREAAREAADDEELTRAIEVVAEQFAGRVTREAVLAAEPLPEEADDDS